MYYVQIFHATNNRWVTAHGPFHTMLEALECRDEIAAGYYTMNDGISRAVRAVSSDGELVEFWGATKDDSKSSGSEE